MSSFLTIQEGCDKFCKFCVVPYTRGPESSRSFYKIIDEAKQLISNGSKEITLLGQNVNAYLYEKNGKEYRLSDLIMELDKFPELKRMITRVLSKLIKKRLNLVIFLQILEHMQWVTKW